MPYTTDFIVESVDKSDETWKLFNTIYKLDDEDQDPHVKFAKKFTSMATVATIFRWKFGDQQGNPTIETTLNPYIHRFYRPGTYSVSHQSCAPCLSMDPPLICSPGWCTKSVTIVSPSDSGVLVATAGLVGLFIIAKGDNCCDLRKECAKKRAICTTIKPEDIANTKECNIIEEICTEKLEDCRKKCVKTGHIWQPLPYKCIENRKPYKEVCQTIEHQKKYKKTNENKDK